MSSSDHIAEDPERTEWDVAVVGTGMGGATVGHALARLGHRVLFLEKGHYLHGELGVHRDGAAPSRPGGDLDNRPEARLRRGWWPLPLQGATSFGKMDFFAPLGCGSGGSTTLYAAALERLRPVDFRPRANFPGVTDSTLPEAWPISYEDLRPYYRRAEELYRVRGTHDPLNPDRDCFLLEPPPLSERDQHFFESFGRLGLHPYRVHAGYEFLPGCEQCAGSLCPRACKNDAARICLVPALAEHSARILPRCEVVGLEAGASEVKRVLCRHDGRDVAIRARIVVLAAGAFMTPILLLNSKSEAWPDGLANRSGMVGRNLMLHAGDFIVVRPTERLSTAGPQKSMSLNDFYLSDGEKLGAFQTLGAAISTGGIMRYLRSQAQRDRRWWRRLASPRPVWWQKLSSPFIRAVASIARYRFMNAAIWATIIEDLPYHDNRVVPDPDARNGMRFEYTYTDELKNRVRSFRRKLSEKLAPHRILFLSDEDNINYGHVCGTCRFGDDPATSVLDANNRAHDVSNLYAVDASFFPSSGGTNPSLTIAANALRVAEAIESQLARADRS